MYEDNKTVVRCAVGVSCGFKAGVGYVKGKYIAKSGITSDVRSELLFVYTGDDQADR